MWLSYVKIVIAGLLPAGLAVLLTYLEKHTRLKNFNPRAKQVVYGFGFGLLAILGTEWGIPLNDAQLNCRDAAVLTCSFCFGGPAGILAGFMGGLERWLSVYWGVGSFTRVACSLSTFLAGFIGYLARIVLFRKHRPRAFIAFIVAVFTETFHLTMVFITNMDTPVQAMSVVRANTLPLICANAFATAFACHLVALVNGDFRERKGKKKSITTLIQSGLMFAIVILFLVTTQFVYTVQKSFATDQVNSELEMALEETCEDIEDGVERDVLVRFIRNRRVGETGSLLIYSAGETIPNMGGADPDTTFLFEYNGETCYTRYTQTKDYTVIAMLPETEAMQTLNISIYVNTFMEILVYGIFFGMINSVLRRTVVSQLDRVNTSMSRIIGGDLDVQINVRDSLEMSYLSDTVNHTVGTLKNYIEDAKSRIDQELKTAKTIQSSVLPTLFPKKKSFDIFATMTTAKEVGGDFYDCYMTGEDTLNFMIADVSGKGVPAAMFMMRAKAELKNHTETEATVGDAFTQGNHALCEGNDADMFVTAWQGRLNTETGLLTYVCAGHNPPVLVKKDGTASYVRGKAGFVLAGMDGIPYKEQTVQLEPGDTLFLYTDGVTEATDEHQQLFGEDRLLQTLSNKDFEDMKAVCREVMTAVNLFVGEAEQFDDITMLALHYNGVPPLPTMHFEEASLDQIPEVTEFVEAEMEKRELPMKTVIQFNVALDEIYSNIVKYGYPDEKKGPVTVQVIDCENPNRICLKFTDEGIPYNPLNTRDPDVTLSAEERNIGGLGIYMVKKSMDDLKYRYENGQNILTIIKNL